ncbi:molybdopterin-dependent oxidoreductase [Flavonifractor plautii]|nr:molybdopterin-dependent oxidoreductase [Flavonifractor plautii]
MAQSKYVVTQSYRTPFTEHAFLEPECAVAFPYKDGVKVYTSDQGCTTPARRSPSCWGGSPSASWWRTSWWGAASAARRTCRCSTWRCWPPSG